MGFFYRLFTLEVAGTSRCSVVSTAYITPFRLGSGRVPVPRVPPRNFARHPLCPNWFRRIWTTYGDSPLFSRSQCEPPVRFFLFFFLEDSVNLGCSFIPTGGGKAPACFFWVFPYVSGVLNSSILESFYAPLSFRSAPGPLLFVLSPPSFPPVW